MLRTGIGLGIIKFLKTDLLKKCQRVSSQLFNKYLLVTNLGISASLSFTGDILQQNYEMLKLNKKSWDHVRSTHMTASGLTVGFVCHFWYNFLDHRLPGRSLSIVLKKVFIDQMVCSPVYITTFFATTCYLEEKSFKEFRIELVQKGWRLFVAECIIWPPAQVVNFYFLPTKFRVLYDNVISLGYDVYTSYVKHEIPIENDEL